MRILFSLTFTSIVVCISLFVGCSDSNSKALAKSTYKVVLASEIKWEQLNPARGDKSPKAGTIWGDRNGSGPTGFFVKFVDGFSSPPHIHNVSYRGVVVSGFIHNDDPNAKNMWMPKGSFWTQPKGESHITAAKGEENIAYIEIDEGPYLVLPPEKAFDSGERPINIHQSNIIWIDQPGRPSSANTPKRTFLWGKPQKNQLSGSLVKLPAGFAGKIRSYGSVFRAVVIQGDLKLQIPNEKSTQILKPGSYFSSQEKSTHQFSCAEDCIVYLHTNGKFDIIP